MSDVFDFVHEQASMMAGGLGDFGDTDYHEPLRLLLGDYEKHAKPTALGKQILSGAVITDLAGRLHEEAGFKAHAGQLDRAIRKPIFIIGMARTGTTVLLRLLGADSANQSLPLWLGNKPMRRPSRDTWESNPYFQQVQAGLDALAKISPRFNELHPQHASAADECRFLLNHTFRSPSLAVTARVPEYEAWVNAVDMHPVYRRYRKALNLISDSGQRWVLKCPSHLWSLHTILDTFPDACIVMTHRDPEKSFPSLFDLVYQFRQFTEEGIERARYGRQNFGTWGWVLDKAEKDRKTIARERIYDIHSDDIRADPVGSAQRIYRHFDIPVSEQALAAWRRLSSESPTGGHASHSYTAEDYGLSAREIHDSCGDYYQRYQAVVRERLAA